MIISNFAVFLGTLAAFVAVADISVTQACRRLSAAGLNPDFKLISVHASMRFVGRDRFDCGLVEVPTFRQPLKYISDQNIIIENAPGQWTASVLPEADWYTCMQTGEASHDGLRALDVFGRRYIYPYQKHSK